MNHLNTVRSIHRQQGVAVLVVAVVILLLITMLVFISSNTTLTGLRLSNNDFRGRQAFEAAETGLAYAEAYFKENGISSDLNGTSPVVGLFNTTDQPSFTLTTSDIGITDTLRVSSTGQSDDGTASRTVEVVMQFKKPVPGGPGAPLTARGSAGALGNAKIENAFGNVTVRAGQDAPSGGSADTYICDGCIKNNDGSYNNVYVDDAGLPELLQDLEGTDPGVYTGSGIDIIANDPSLSALTNDDFFNGFFEGNRDTIIADADLVGDGTMDFSPPPNNPLFPFVGQLIVINDDITINAGDRIGCTETSTSAGATCTFAPNDPATNEVEPVALVILGDLTLNGGAEIYGLLYVGEDSSGHGGNINVVGNPIVYGSVAVENNYEGAGNLTIVYHPDLAFGPRGFSSNFMAGSWKDW